MTVNEVINHLQTMVATNPHIGSKELVIPIFKPGVMGGHPCVKITGMYIGIDFDHGKVLINPEQELKTLK